MKILKKFNDVCKSCCEEHEIWLIEDNERTIFKSETIDYKAMYYYCQYTDEFYEDEELMKKNQLALKDKYREKMNLLTSKEIVNIRKKYKISQKDLSKLLGLSPVTIIRYENYQIQDKAHDIILRKLNEDPNWFIDLLYKSKQQFSDTLYKKYFSNAKKLQEELISKNIMDNISIRYQSISKDKYCGKKELDLKKVCDVINYLCTKIDNIYKVKLMKLLWYCDSLYYKYFDCSITGLAYEAEKMGALPICHNEIVLLPDVCYETIEFDYGYGYKFYAHDHYTCQLSKKERTVIDQVIEICGKLSREEIVHKMHQEDAYKLTKINDLIDYSLVKSLSIK